MLMLVVDLCCVAVSAGRNRFNTARVRTVYYSEKAFGDASAVIIDRKSFRASFILGKPHIGTGEAYL